jgi:S-adenosylmethionine decarboxylase
MEAAPDHFKVDATGVQYAGDHLLIELWGADQLVDASHIERVLSLGAETAGATILHAYFHAFGEGMGVSGVLVLSESHISIHTWPERSYAAIDIFMCGDCNPYDAIPVIKAAFHPQKIDTHFVKRGVIDNTTHLELVS